MEQNATSAGRLVPGLRRRSLWVVFGMFAVLALAFAAMFTVQFGWSPVPLAMLVIALCLASAPALHPQFLIAPVILCAGLFVLPSLTSRVEAAAFVSVTLTTAVLVLAPIVLAIWVWAELRFLGVPARRPQSIRETVLDWHRRLMARKTFASVAALMESNPRPAALAAKGAVGKLIMLGNHYDRATLGIVLGMQIGLWLSSARNDMSLVVLLYVSAVFQILMAFSIGARLHTHLREQALVRHAPRAPGAHHFNAVLGRELINEYLIAWTGTTLVALGATFLMTRQLGYVASMLIVFLLTLPAAGLFLRNHARSVTGMATKALFAVWIAIFAAAPYWVRQQSMEVQALCAVLALVAGGVTIAVALQHMRRAPIAYPVGRLR